jgi:protein SCO1/2
MTMRALWVGSLFLMTCGAAAQGSDAAMTSRPLNPASDQSLTVLDPQTALRVSQSVVGNTIPDVALLTRNGDPVRLHDYKGKPLLVSFMYTGCFQVCPTASKNLQKTLDGVVAKLGPQAFNVISIGFNQPADSPQALKAFANQNGMHLPNWEFLSPAVGLVPELTRGFGFSYVQTTAGFDHLNQVTLVDQSGRIVRQIYGTSFSADLLIEPLRELGRGVALPAEPKSLEALIDKVILLCSRYDPISGRYRVDYRIFMELAGLVTFVIAMLWFVWQEWRQARVRERRFP